MTIATAIDLYCGCGGMSTGLLDAGVEVKAGFDFDERSIVTYDYNHRHRGASGRVIDLGLARGSDLLELAGLTRVDLVVGGPPCQSFSIAGKQKGLDDSRGQHLFEFLRLIGEIRPRAFIAENVPNLARLRHGRVFEAFTAAAEQLGYSVSHAELYGPDYGLPQMRRRIFVVGVLGAPACELPPPATHRSAAATLFNHALPIAPTCRDALHDLPDVWDEGADAIPNHEPTMHSPAMVDAFRRLEPGQRDRKSFHDRLDPDKPSYTLRAGNGNFSPLRPVHYHFDRVVSVRESARLQGFSDAFIWPDTIPRLQQYRQVGNAVPPPMMKAVIMHVLPHLALERDPLAFQGDPASRPPHETRSFEARLEERRARIRGASTGSGRSITRQH